MSMKYAQKTYFPFAQMSSFLSFDVHLFKYIQFKGFDPSGPEPFKSSGLAGPEPLICI